MAFCEIELSTGLVISPDTAEVVTHTREADTTEHPVEDGSTIADHVIVKPRSFSMTTLWTPRPWDAFFLPSGPNRPAQAFDILATACQQKTSLSIQIDDVNYRPVILTSVTMQRQFADGDSRVVQLECKEITIVEGKTVAVRVAPALKPKGKKKNIKANLIPGLVSYEPGQSNNIYQTIANITPPAEYVEMANAANPTGL